MNYDERMCKNRIDRTGVVCMAMDKDDRVVVCLIGRSPAVVVPKLDFVRNLHLEHVRHYWCGCDPMWSTNDGRPSCFYIYIERAQSVDAAVEIETLKRDPIDLAQIRLCEYLSFLQIFLMTMGYNFSTEN